MKISIEIDDRVVQRTFNHWLATGRDMSPKLRNVGEQVLNTTRERFRTEKAPDGRQG